MLAVGDPQEARSACRELEEISARYESGMLAAMVAHAEGAVELAEGDARAALLALRRAWQVCQELEVPYGAARVRELVGLAAPSATTTRPRWSWKQPEMSWHGWEQRRTSPASIRSPGAPPPPMFMG
jgi:hypothetical protein